MADFDQNMYNLDPIIPDPNIPDPTVDETINNPNSTTDENFNYGLPAAPINPTPVNPTFTEQIAGDSLNFPTGYEMRQEFDYKPIQEYLAPDIHEGWTTAVDVETANMIEANAPNINRYSIGGVSNTLGLRPGPSGVDYNPVGMSAEDQALQNLGNFTLDPANKQTKYEGDPMQFGIRSSNLQRYYEHNKFHELGFNPYVDNESYYNANSSNWDDWARMIPHFGSQFATGFSSIWRSIGDLFDDDPYFTAPDIESAQEMEDAMRIGMSTKSGVSPFMSNLALNLGYTTGIISEIALEELVLWGAAALQGGLNPASDALAVGATVRNAGRITRLATGFTKMVGRTKAMLNEMRAANVAKGIYNVSKGIVKGTGKFTGKLLTPNTLYAMKYWRTTGKAAENMTNLAKVSRTAGAFYRDLRAVNLAVSEAKLEGGLVYNERIQTGIQQWYAKPENKGKQMTSSDMDEIVKNATDAAATTALWNAPFIFLTNRLVLTGALTGFKPISRLMDESLSGFQRRVMRQAAMKGGAPQKNIWKKMAKGPLGGWLPSREMVKQWTIKGSVKRGAAGSLRYFSANLGEGVQELYQEAVSHGVKDYYGKIFDDPSYAGQDAVLAAMGEGIQSQWSKEGGEVFMSGFLMGGMIQGPQKLLFDGMPALYQMKFQKEKWAEYQKNKEDYIDLAVSNLNKVHNEQMSNPDKYMDIERMMFVAQKQATEDMMDSAYKGDVYGFYNAKDDLKYRAIYSVIGEYKMKGYFQDQLRDYINLDDKMLMEAFPAHKTDIKNGKFRERMQDMIDQIDIHDKAIKKDMRDNKNPYDRSLYEHGSKEWRRELLRERAYEHVRYLKLFTNNKFQRAEERVQEIDKMLESHPVLSKIAANDLVTLSDLKTLDREMNLLKEDIKLTDAKTETEKKLLKSKTDKLRLIENIHKVLSNEKNYNKTGERKGHFSKKKINVLEKSIVKYLEFLAEQKGDQIKWSEVKDAVQLLVDRNNLKDDSGKYARSARFLSDKNEFEKIVDLTFEVLEKRFKNAKAETRDRIKKYVAQQEGVALLKAFENLEEGDSVVATPEAIDFFFKNSDASIFLETTEDGTLKYLFTETGNINKEGSPLLYNEIVRLVGQYNRAQGKTESEATADYSVGDEFDVSDLTEEETETTDDETVKKPKRKVEILKDEANKVLKKKHRSYISKTIISGNKQPLTEAGYKKSQEGQNIIKTFIRLEEQYEEYLATVPEGSESLNFEQWLATNETNPLIADIVNKYGMSFSDFSSEPIPENIPQDKLQPADKPVKGYQNPGLYLIERTGQSEDNKSITYYVILDEDGLNTAETYADLGTEKIPIKENYISLKEAKEAYKKIESELPDDALFDFDKVEGLHYGKIVTATKTNAKQGIVKGKDYVIISTLAKLRRGAELGKRRLFLVAFDEIGNKKPKQVKLLTGQFKNQFELKDEIYDPVITNTSKLSPNEFTTFYAWENKRMNETKADAQMRMDYILNNLTNEELNSLEFQITLNKNLNNPEPFSIKKTKDGKQYEPNNQILIGSERYSIALVATDPALKQKIENILKESGAFSELIDNDGNNTEQYLNSDGIIAFYPAALQRVFKDSSGNEIEVPNMTSAQIRQIFRPSYNFDNRNPIYLDKHIKDGYAKQQYILNQLLQAYEAGETTIPLSNLDGDVILKSSPGRLAYVPKGAELAPMSELTNNSADDNGNVLILDNQRVDTKYTQKDLKQLEKDNPDTVYKVDNNGNVYIVAGNPISNLKGKKLTKLYNDVKVGMGNFMKDAMAAGRYVAIIKLPNGVYTYAELQSQKLSEEEVNNILLDIKERATDTIKNNVNREEGEPWSDVTVKDEFYNTKKTKNYPEGYNNELNKKFYIYSLPGYTVSMKVSSYGYVQLEFYNQRNSEKTFTIKIDQDRISEMKPDITSFNEVVSEIVSQLVTRESELSKSQKNALDTLVTGGAIFSTENFRKSVDRKITDVQEFLNTLNSKIDSRIRYDVGLLVDVTDSSEIQSIKVKEDSAQVQLDESENEVTKSDVIENETKTIDELSEEAFNESRQLGFEDISDEQLQIIADKNQDKLSSREALVVKVLDKRYQPLLAAKAVNMNTAAEKHNKLKTRRKEVLAEIEVIKQENREAAEALHPEDTVKMNQERIKLNRKDKRIVELEKEKKKIDGQLAKGALKVIDKNERIENPENLDTFVAWVESVLPEFITIGDINTLRDRIITNGYTVGAFVMNLKQISGGIDINGTIFTGENMPSRYHEAFHAVFRMLLTPEEQAVYYSAAAKEVREKLRKEGKVFNEELQKLKNSSEIYSEMTLEQLKKEYYEEYMADEFQKFKKNPKSTKTNSLIKSLFNRFVEWIKSIFSNKNRSELTDLYKAIDEGRYKNATIQNNAFTDKQTLLTGANIALAQIPIDFIEYEAYNPFTKQEETQYQQIYMPARDVDKILYSIAAVYTNRKQKAKGTWIGAEQIEDILDQFAILYNPESEINLIKPDLDQMEDQLRLYSDAFENPITRMEIRLAVEKILGFADLQINEKEEILEEEEDEKGLRDTSQWDKDASMIGGFSSLSSGIRQFILTTAVQSTDSFGNTELPSGEKLIVPVNVMEAYNLLLKASANRKSSTEILKALNGFTLNGNYEGAAVVDRIFTEIGLSREDVAAGNFENIKNPYFYNSVMKAFDQVRLDYIFVHRDQEGNVLLYDAASRDDAKSQFNHWNDAYDMQFDKLRFDSQLREEIIDELREFQSEYFTESISSLNEKEYEQMIQDSKKYANLIQDKLGISLSPVYLQYSVLQNVLTKDINQQALLDVYDAEALEFEDLNQMMLHLNLNRNFFVDEADEGIRGRIEKLARGNAIFDERIGASVFRNPNGDLVYAHQLPTMHTVKINQLNDINKLENLKDVAYLEKNALLNDPYFYQLATENRLQVIRVAGSKEGGNVDEDTLVETSGIANDIEGSTYGESTPKEFITDLINVYTYFYNTKRKEIDGVSIGEDIPRAIAPSLIRVIEASNQGDFIGLPVIKTVTKNNDGETALTEETIQKFVTELQNEYDRIRRESNEDTKTTDLIDGYNARLAGNDLVPDDTGRAYKLTNTGNLVTPKTERSIDRSKAVDRMYASEGQTELLFDEANPTNLIIRTPATSIKLGIRPGETATVEITKKGKKAADNVTEEFTLRSRGKITVDSSNIDSLIKAFGSSVVTTKKEGWPELRIGDKVWWVENFQILQFLRGKKAMVAYDIAKGEVESLAVEEVVEEGVVSPIKGINDVFELHPELSNIGSKQDYINYLTTIFPDSQLKDILFHGSNKRIEEVKEFQDVEREEQMDYPIEDGIFFSREKEYSGNSHPAEEYGKVITAAIVNIKNPEKGYETDAFRGRRRNKKSDAIFGTYVRTQKEDTEKQKARAKQRLEAFKPENHNIVVVFKPSQVHLLGNEKDLGMFKEFVESGSEVFEKTKLTETEIFNGLKAKLEAAAVEGKTFAQAINDIEGLNEDVLKSLIEERLIQEFEDFRITLDEIRATGSISSKITEGFKNENGKVGPQENDAMEALNLKPDDAEFNLMQVFFNDWLNSKSFNDLILGDQAMSLKDAVDKIKRAKAQNAAGYSAQTDIFDPSIDILHPVENISLFTITDPKYQQLFDFGANRQGDKADAQMWMTIKAFQYMWFGFGKLNAKQQEIIEKLKRGEKLTSEDVFGNPETGVSGLKSFNAFINSKKLVYADGDTFLKMSAFVLTKELTSRKNSKGEWIAKENRKELHNLRVNLEQFETREWEENGNGTLAIAAPMSASKMRKGRVLNEGKLFNEELPLNLNQSTTLSAEWMRLQMINPSNKVIITDPTQMKSIITSEQKDDTAVIINGKETDLGTIRKAYQKSTSNRGQLKFVNQRNLLLDFNIETAMRELETSKINNQFTVDLYSFLEYAIDGLEASQTSASIIEYFRQDTSGESRNLNNPITISKFEQLFLSYFGKQVFREKIPGHKVSLLSGKGFKVYRKVLSVDENGQPLRSEIIRDDQWEAMNENERPTLFRTEFDDVQNKTFVGLEQALKDNIKGGVVVLDELRFNAVEFDENGKETGQRYAEFIMPPHFKSIMDKVIATGGETITVSEIEKKWKTWANTKSFSPKANDFIVRSEIEGFDANRSKKEYAAAFGYATTTNQKGNTVFLPKNGKGMVTIPAALAKAFGVRIPSQDMHSSINLKLVDFMPAFYGSTAVFPDQLIEVSGADFDIDALYMQVKEFYEENGEFKAYGDATTKIGKYREYIDYQMKDAYATNSSLNAARKKYLAKGVNMATSLTDKQKAKAKEAGLSDDVIGALMILGLPITQKQYETYKEERTYTVGKGKTKMTFQTEPYAAPMNNDILDQKFALLGNEAMTQTVGGRQVPVAYESAVIDPLITEWKWIEENLPELAELVQEDDVDVDNLNGKLKAWTNNKEGARSIGAAVLPNVIVNLLAEANVKYRSIKVNNRETYPQIKYNGVTFRDFNTQFEIDLETGKQNPKGERTQFIISALITAMTDNAKERLAAKLGLNKDALATVVNLTALGVPIRTSILLINNPLIKNFYWENANRESKTEAGIYAMVKAHIRDMETSYANIYDKNLSQDAKVEVTNESLMEAIKEMKSFNRDERKYGTLFTAKNAEERRYSKSMFHRDYAILKQWQNAHRLKKFTGEMQSMVNLAKTLGQNFRDVTERNMSIDNLGLFYEGPYSSLTMSNITKEGIELPLEEGWRKIFKGDDSTFHGNNVNMDRQLQELLPKIFLSKTKKFTDILNTTMANLNPRVVNDIWKGADIHNRVSTDLLAYVTMKAYIQGLRKAGKPISLSSLNNGLIYKENDSAVQIDDVIIKLRKIYEGKENYFLNRFIFNDSAFRSTNKTGVSQIKSTTWTKVSPAQVEKIQNSFADIFSNPETRADAIHIAHYVMVKDGLQFKSGSILSALAPFIYDLYIDYVDIAHEAFQTKEDDKAFADIFGMSHAEMVKDFVYGYLNANPINWMLPTMGNVKRRGRNIQIYAPDSNKFKTASFAIDSVQQDTENIYIYPESEGYAGNARIQDLENAFGIQFKIDGGSTESSYYTNNDEADFKVLIDSQIKRIKDDGRPIVLPRYFISKAEKSNVYKYGPKIFNYLKQRMKDEFDYNISTNQIESEGTISKKAAANQPALILETEEGTGLIIDLYNGVLGRPNDNQSKNELNERHYQNPSQKANKQISRNLSILEASHGFNSVRKDTKFGVRTELIFPAEIRIKQMESIQNEFGRLTQIPTYRTFKLNKAWSGSNTGSNEIITANQPLTTGSRAEYIETEPVGSNQATPIAFSFDGIVPTYKDVRRGVIAREDGSLEDNSDIGMAEGTFDSNRFKTEEEIAKELAVQNNNVKANENEVIVGTKNISEYTDAPAVEEETPSIPADENIGDDVEGGIGINEILNFANENEESFTEIEDFFDEIDDMPKAESEAMYKNLKDFAKISDYQSAVEVFQESDFETQDEFLDYLKKCSKG